MTTDFKLRHVHLSFLSPTIVDSSPACPHLPPLTMHTQGHIAVSACHSHYRWVLPGPQMQHLPDYAILRPHFKRFLKPASRPHPSLNIPSSRPIHKNIFPCDSRTISKLLLFPQASHKARILDIKQPQALTLNISRAPQVLQYARSRVFQSGICSPAVRCQIFAWLPPTTPSDCLVPLWVYRFVSSCLFPSIATYIATSEYEFSIDVITICANTLIFAFFGTYYLLEWYLNASGVEGRYPSACWAHLRHLTP
ncbi:hypothetical protein B0H13DRAFT_1856439 [Mycena leptocephala]|nr:hypothetical protein B0H13DRAFT_1856439 [Mycena leptocephala]